MKTCLLFFVLLNISPLYPDQTLLFKEDGRTFVFAGDAKTGEITFVPEGETLEDWKEVFVVHHVLQSIIPLRSYYENFMSALNKKSSGLFNSQIIQETDSSLLFEWWMDADIPGAQHGWVKIFYTRDGMGFLRYTTKNLDLVEKNKPIWENILSTYQVDLIPKQIDVKINWNQDPKKWARDDTLGVESYYPQDESEKVEEEVTIEKLAHTPENLREYYKNEVNKLGARVQNLKARILFDTEGRILYEWGYKDGQKNVHLWTFISKENPKAAVAVKHYLKSEQNIQDRQAIWERILKDVKVDVDYNFMPIKKEPDESASQSKK